MTKQLGPDPLDELLAADPLADRLSPASLARIRARVSEDVMTTPTPRPRRTWGARHLGLGAGVAALGALALVLAVGGPGTAPGTSPVGSPGTGSAACVEPYSQTAITHRTFAFDGIVAAVDGEQVTFSVGTAYRGAAGGTITLDAPGMTGTAITSAGGPNLSVGQRYLVAGDDHFVWACGYTQPYDPTVAAEWQAAFGG
jgi:hypothetical protein